MIRFDNLIYAIKLFEEYNKQFIEKHLKCLIIYNNTINIYFIDMT